MCRRYDEMTRGRNKLHGVEEAHPEDCRLLRPVPSDLGHDSERMRLVVWADGQGPAGVWIDDGAESQPVLPRASLYEAGVAAACLVPARSLVTPMPWSSFCSLHY